MGRTTSSAALRFPRSADHCRDCARGRLPHGVERRGCEDGRHAARHAGGSDLRPDHEQPQGSGFQAEGQVTMARKFVEAAIAGIGATEFSKESGRSELQLAAECAKAACDDAGVDPRDIDGMITFTIDNSDEISLSRCLGVKDLAY